MSIIGNRPDTPASPLHKRAGRFAILGWRFNQMVDRLVRSLLSCILESGIPIGFRVQGGHFTAKCCLGPAATSTKYEV